MNVLVLLETRGGGEGLATLWASVGAGPNVLRADVTLQVTGVCEHLREGKRAGHITYTRITPCGILAFGRGRGTSHTRITPCSILAFGSSAHLDRLALRYIIL